jgi:hypothetical protein
MSMSDEELNMSFFLDYLRGLYTQFPGYSDAQIVAYVIRANSISARDVRSASAQVYQCIAYLRKQGFISQRRG